MKTMIRLMVASAIMLCAFSANAKRFYVPANTVIHAGPCDYTVTGWVEVGVFSGRLEHCDLHLSGPCGKMHFTAFVVNPDDPNSGYGTTLTDDETGSPVSDPPLVGDIIDAINADPVYWTSGDPV